jgi:chorismate-pyruvate lyase
MNTHIIEKQSSYESASAAATCWRSMHSLNERILHANSSTLELELWCREKGIGDGRITVRCNRSVCRRLLDYDSLDALRDCAGDDIAYRSVQLVTDGTILVDADNWYFADRLTSNMRRELEETENSFGRVIASLRARRRTFMVKLCTFAELEAMREHRACTQQTEYGRLNHIFEHRALVHLPDGRPLAVVHERYRATLFASSAPHHVIAAPIEKSTFELP